MDVQKQKPGTPAWRSKSKLVGAGAGIAVLVAVVAALSMGNAMALSERDLVIDSVQQGSLDVTVEGYGELVSARQQLLTSPSQATVKEIVLKPGAEVTADSVIVRLDDPTLLKEFQTAKQELNEAESALRQLRLTNQRETMKEQGSLAELVADHATITAQREAEQKLVTSGIVSRISFEKTVQTERQLGQRIALSRSGMVQLEQLQRESLAVQDEQVVQKRANLDLAQDQLDRLTVKAGIDGVLQKLPVEVGQSLPPGEQVALVGSATDLVALIKVPQGQAQSVRVGNRVAVDTRREKISGKVTRIVPIVANNTVELEVALPAIAGTSARPNLSVDASIIGDRLERVKYVRRPAGVSPGSSAQVYAMKPGSSTATRRSVAFGRSAGPYIEVLSGLDVGERLIVSDLSKLKLDGERVSVN
ncbi:HlyD family efflux transporter periplasmic adaptor subunit [Xanthomonas sp. 1678]|uniref:efflux RND transporter periplasmic adaptor subunit n=1 Tax=Xanthomonas sp. 1678 TaxID=3158788 RepID=UPI00285A63DA|nr:multidrug efflux pump subunit AcrA (membrane-fusion protein) [Xanthomonas translucens]